VLHDLIEEETVLATTCIHQRKTTIKVSSHPFEFSLRMLASTLVAHTKAVDDLLVAAYAIAIAVRHLAAIWKQAP
jgi:hypothetical protein